MKIFRFVFLLFLFSLSLRQISLAQTSKLSDTDIQQMAAYEDTLGVLSFRLQNDTSSDQRLIACHQMIRVLKTALKIDNSFHFGFPRLAAVSIIAPPDSNFRIFTWQLFDNDSSYRYFGAIQMRSKEVKLFPLIDRSHDIEDPLSSTLTHDQWYGGLYYNLISFGTKKQPKYLLFGFDGFSFFEKQKIVDVLTFDADGKPQFGAEVFEWPEGFSHAPDQKRLILQYASEAKVRCNFDPLYDMVLFDHLIPCATSYGQVANVPDGSLDGLKLEKGRWKYIDKVFIDIQEEAPTPAPLDRQGKDIMGRKKG
jgi:hypothetical protein